MRAAVSAPHLEERHEEHDDVLSWCEDKFFIHTRTHSATSIISAGLLHTSHHMRPRLLCCCLLAGASLASTTSLVGTVSGAPAGAVLHVHAYEVPDDGIPITKEDVYLDLDESGTTATARRVNVSRTVAASDGSFSIQASNSSLYTLFAWADTDLDGHISLPHEPCGWFAANGSHWMTPLQANEHGRERIAIRVSGAVPMPSGTRRTANGRLHSVAGLRTLSVVGSPVARGHAHGYLLGQQVIDFFRFFTLQATTISTAFYASRVVPFVNASAGWYHYSADYLAEIDALLAGMRQSPTLINRGSLWVEELGRELERADLLYLNDYGNYPEAPQAMRRACSQFAFWGGASSTGRLIAGRNMDGENDFRKVTVSHFLALSVTADDEGATPFVHFMWPGFVAVASGVSRKGLWVMMNDGESNPEGPPARHLSPFGWVVRKMLSGSPTIASARERAEEHKSSLGGTCSAGCNLMVAVATGGGADDGGGGESGEHETPTRAIVLESDRAHNAWRSPNQVQPLISEGIMVTNHEFLPPAYDPSAPLENWGRQVYFSSLWRYEAGKNLVNAFAEYRVRIGLAEMVRLLQTVTHATTEHTIILEDAGDDGGLVIHVAVADLRVGGWHAPYLRWHRANISEFFFDDDSQSD
jgi:hypothetical protein